MRLLVGLLQIILGWPLWIRVILFLVTVFIIWKIIRKPILFCLSSIPYLLKYIFIGLYRLLEAIITKLHQRFGGIFYKIDNRMSEIGQRVNEFFDSWIKLWKDGEVLKAGVTITLYLICMIWILLPTVVQTDIEWINWAGEIYSTGENTVAMWCEKYYEENIKVEEIEEPPSEELHNETDNASIELIVFNVNSSLLVRDIPDMNAGVALARLHNDDRVIWTGETVFAEAENDRVEMWAKVKTEDGIEGWSRLRYLYPDNYSEKEFWVQEK